MQECAPPHKVLVAVDGSEQSLRAIRYAAGVFPPDRTHIVLFHVQVQLFELFSDLGAYPHYKRQVTGLKRWATEQKMDIYQTMDSAVVYFKQKGFPESAITVKTPAKKLGITQDIIKESYDGYQAIVVGRTGWSRFKDWLIKSAAMKLVAKIKHIPVVVVGGNPDAKNLLVAFDGTHGAMKGVVCVGALVGNSGHHLQLYSMISHEGKFWVGDEEFFIPENAEAPIETGKHRIGPHLVEARSRLLAEGMPPDRISIKIHAVDRDRAPHIVQEAMENHFGGVVLGRRGLITFIDEYFIGRISDKVLKIADQLAVWII
ncbi:MAG: universal stress protein [Desulfosarcina sp.]|nr:universal stress protein [Desulfosarcina sp.]MBC2743754.1 universal stress protein [Desulfosarcina sp.]MBC2766663.1 universal stress protein [Desulfosarcina sp.]